MAVTRLYLRNTQTGGGTGGIFYDLSTTQGTGATLVSASVSGTTFTEVLRWQYTLGSDVPDTVIPTSIDVSAVSASTLEYRWKVERLDSSNNEIASSAYSTALNTTGIKTASLSLSTAWASGDRVAISLELRRTSGAGSRTVTINVNDADSYIDPDLIPIPQALTQNTRFDNAATFYGPTVDRGPVTLLPGLYSNANTFYAAAVFTDFEAIPQDFGLITGTPDVYQNWGLITEAADKTFNLGDLDTAVVLFPARFNNTNTFYAATVTARRTLTPALFSNTNTFYAAAVVSTRQLFPGLYSNANTFYAPVLAATYALAPGLYTNTSTIYAPSAAATNTLLPALLSDGDTFYGPTLAATYTIAPGLFSDGDTFYSAAASSVYGLQPGLYENSNAFYGPSLSLAPIELLPGLLSNINVFYSPVVSSGGFIILVPLVENENSFYDHEIFVTGGGDGDLPRISRLFSTGTLMNRI